MIIALLKPIYLMLYNKKHHTRIKSIHASVNADYGENVLIDKNTIVERDVSIGDNSYVNKNSSVENCIIGKYCSISSGVFICPFEHNLSAVSTHPNFDLYGSRKKKRKPVIIGNDVLISLNAIILEGVTIGDGAVIGAGAVVTKDVKPYEIVGGVPAKHLRYRFSEEDTRRLETIQWWNWPKEKVEFYRNNFTNIKDFLAIVSKECDEKQ